MSITRSIQPRCPQRVIEKIDQGSTKPLHIDQAKGITACALCLCYLMGSGRTCLAKFIFR